MARIIKERWIGVVGTLSAPGADLPTVAGQRGDERGKERRRILRDT